MTGIIAHACMEPRCRLSSLFESTCSTTGSAHPHFQALPSCSSQHVKLQCKAVDSSLFSSTCTSSSPASPEAYHTLVHSLSTLKIVLSYFLGANKIQMASQKLACRKPACHKPTCQKPIRFLSVTAMCICTYVAIIDP